MDGYCRDSAGECALHQPLYLAVRSYSVWWLQALYQPARDLLNEALQAARAFEEKELEARTLYLLAKLSFFEAQYLQAMTLCTRAQVRLAGVLQQNTRSE